MPSWWKIALLGVLTIVPLLACALIANYYATVATSGQNVIVPGLVLIFVIVPVGGAILVNIPNIIRLFMRILR